MKWVLQDLLALLETQEAKESQEIKDPQVHLANVDPQENAVPLENPAQVAQMDLMVREDLQESMDLMAHL